jgi:hypothetical protein
MARWQDFSKIFLLHWNFLLELPMLLGTSS